jgi:hypothetical protein
MNQLLFLSLLLVSSVCVISSEQIVQNLTFPMRYWIDGLTYEQYGITQGQLINQASAIPDSCKCDYASERSKCGIYGWCYSGDEAAPNLYATNGTGTCVISGGQAGNPCIPADEQLYAQFAVEGYWSYRYTFLCDKTRTYCDSASKICVAKKSAGGACSGSDDCAKGFYCNGTNNAPAGVCVAQAALGGACYSQSRQSYEACAKVNDTNANYCDFDTNTCKARVGTDGPCTGHDGTCLDSHYCHNTAVNGTVSYACKPRAGVGAACDNVVGPRCSNDQECKPSNNNVSSGTCQAGDGITFVRAPSSDAGTCAYAHYTKKPLFYYKGDVTPDGTICSTSAECTNKTCSITGSMGICYNPTAYDLPSLPTTESSTAATTGSTTGSTSSSTTASTTGNPSGSTTQSTTGNTNSSSGTTSGTTSNPSSSGGTGSTSSNPTSSTNPGSTTSSSSDASFKSFDMKLLFSLFAIVFAMF